MKRTKDKGITLIALVITIIILLIIAGVTIATLFGENGILNRASKAAEETNKQSAIEDIKLKIIEVQAEKQGSATLADLVEYLSDDSITDEYNVTLERSQTSKIAEGSKTSGDVGSVEKIYITNLKYGYEVEVYKNLTVNETVITTGKTEQNNNNKNTNTSTESSELESRISALERKMNSIESYDENDYNNLKTKVSNIGKIFTGTVLTNTMGESESFTNINSFTVTEKGNYIISAFVHGRRLEGSLINLRIQLNNDDNCLAMSSHVMNKTLPNVGTTASAITSLNVGDVVYTRLYSVDNGISGENNLKSNKLELIKIGE